MLSAVATDDPVYRLVLEFTRAERAGEPHAFRFAPQTYLLRTPGGGFEGVEFPWTRALLDDLKSVREPSRGPEVVHRVGEVLRRFLGGAGWDAHERAIVRAAREGARIVITVRSAAAELYALPWELLALRSTGQLVGSIPGLLIRYEWPETETARARTTGGRVLYAWSAAGGAVPAAEHQAALREAGALDPGRDVVAHASYAAIAEALAQAERAGAPYAALHLLCHGGPAGATYGLALDEGAGGPALVVDAGRVQQLLAPHAGTLRLVVIAACDSGNAGELGNSLGSVAQMIHRAGVQAVVASRFPLSVAGSSRFAAAFYPALVQGRACLEQAFLAGREALARDPSQLDWASLQLYSRAADGDATQIFGAGPKAQVPEDRPPARRRGLALAGLGALGVALALALWRPWAGATPADAPAPVVAEAKPEVEEAVEVVKPPEVAEPEVAKPEVAQPEASAEVAKPEASAPKKSPGTGAAKDAAKPSAGRPGKCSAAVRSYIENSLQGTGQQGARLELALEISSEGRLSADVRGGDSGQQSAAREKLDRVRAARLVELAGGGLPCTTRVEWLP